MIRAFASAEHNGERVHTCGACLGRGYFTRPGSLDDVRCSRCTGYGYITAQCETCEIEAFGDALIVSYDKFGGITREICACCAFGESEETASEAVQAIQKGAAA